MKSLIYPKAKPASHCLTELFSIYQNNNWTIRRWNDHTIVPPYYFFIFNRCYSLLSFWLPHHILILHINSEALLIT